MVLAEKTVVNEKAVDYEQTVGFAQTVNNEKTVGFEQTVGIMNTEQSRTRQKRRVAVIGGGASGCMAAIAAARAGAFVTLFEKNEKPAKKIYATGNGRCNLTNRKMDASFYRSGAKENPEKFVRKTLELFSQEDLLAFFAQAGVPVHDREGYVYPRTDQAETIALVLEKELRRAGVRVETGCSVRSVEPTVPVSGIEGKKQRSAFPKHTSADTGFVLRLEEQKSREKSREKSRDRESCFDAVILCTGGLAGPAFGCSGDGYRFAESMSHTIAEPLPSLTKLTCDEPLLRRAAGVRCHASVRLSIGDQEEGEVQITEDSISGIPVFQLSGSAARALAQKRQVYAVIDFLPEFSDPMFEEEIRRRLLEDRNQTLGAFFLGLAHKKVIDLILARAGLQAEMKAKRLNDETLRKLFREFRNFSLTVSGTGTFVHAQVTSGGVLLSEINENFESRKIPGLYFAGELLDVDGRCGGYNLQWAMSSGFLAGQAAARM